jgi:hypothetical protein
MKHSLYAWRIDKDLLGDEPGAVGVIGPHNAPDDAAQDDFVARLEKGEGRHFRMRDDDGVLYYQGRMVSNHWVCDAGPTGFEPLDDYGTPNAGCTMIEWKEEDGAWTPL